MGGKTDRSMGGLIDAIHQMATEDRCTIDTSHTVYATENKSPWLPCSPEIVVDWTGWPLEEVRAQFGDTVLVRHGVSGVEFRRGVPDPAQVLAEVTAIIARGRA